MSDLFSLYVEAGSLNGGDQPQSAQRWAADEIQSLRQELTAARDEVERLRGRVAQLKSAVPWTIYGDNLTATVLRKQAEAIEAWLHGEPEMGGLDDYAQRLRNQAEELEAGGGDASM